MARRRLLLLLKPLDVYPSYPSNELSRVSNPKPIRDVDLVVTIGGDGTLLQASHFLDNSIPDMGLHSDPTKAEEVQEFSEDFDATRSSGYLCAATVEIFEQIVDNIPANQAMPSEVARMSIRANSEELSAHAVNDVLIAHPCPATVLRFSLKIWRQGEQCSSLVNSRSSGFRVSTAAGSTAAMLSPGGFAMPILSRDLQYMVREPISPIEIKWFSKEGKIYIDGSHLVYSVEFGDTIELSSNSPTLKIFLPSNLLS